MIGPRYLKSLRDLLKGPMGINDRKDVVRYRALQKMGLVDGVALRCVHLTKAGHTLLATGVLVAPPPPAETPNYYTATTTMTVSSSEAFNMAFVAAYTNMPF